MKSVLCKDTGSSIVQGLGAETDAHGVKGRWSVYIASEHVQGEAFTVDDHDELSHYKRFNLEFASGADHYSGYPQPTSCIAIHK